MYGDAQNDPAHRRMFKQVVLEHGICCLRSDSRCNFISKGFAMFKRVFAILLTLLSIAGAAATVTGCNTIEGAGKDVQQAGGAIRDEANEHK